MVQCKCDKKIMAINGGMALLHCGTVSPDRVNMIRLMAIGGAALHACGAVLSDRANMSEKQGHVCDGHQVGVSGMAGERCGPIIQMVNGSYGWVRPGPHMGIASSLMM